MGAATRTMVFIIAASLLANSLGLAAPAPAPAPAPAGRTTPCTLPNGAEISAPEQSGTSTQYAYYYFSYQWTYYSSYYYSYYDSGRKLLQRSVPAPAPSSAPRCCPTTTTKQGDTVSGLISGAGLPDDSKVFFYTINPTVQNGSDNVPAGTTVTVPCFRITEYYRLAANARAPAAAVTG